MCIHGYTRYILGRYTWYIHRYTMYIYSVRYPWYIHGYTTPGYPMYIGQDGIYMEYTLYIPGICRRRKSGLQMMQLQKMSSDSDIGYDIRIYGY
jgi:hypothetical protein